MSDLSASKQRSWIADLEKAFEIAEVDVDKKKIAIATMRTDSQAREVCDAMSDFQTADWDSFKKAFKEACSPNVGIDRANLLHSLQRIAFTGNFKTLVTDVDSLRMRARNLSMDLPPDLFSDALLTAMQPSHADLVRYMRASMDTENYIAVRMSVLKMAAEVSPSTSLTTQQNVPERSSSQALLAAMDRLTTRLQGPIQAPTVSQYPPRSQPAKFFCWKPGISPCRFCKGQHLHRDCPTQKDQGGLPSQQGRGQPTWRGGRGRGRGRSNRPFSGKCDFCLKPGHKASQCWIRQKGGALMFGSEWKQSTQQAQSPSVQPDQPVTAPHEAGELW